MEEIRNDGQVEADADAPVGAGVEEDAGALGARRPEPSGVLREREGLALSTFGWWRRKLTATDRGHDHYDGAWFVELAEDGADREESVAEALGWEVELELRGGMVLRLRRARSC